MPLCPLHQTPMNEGKKGGWYCPKKMPDGSYCQQRIAATPAPAPVQTPVAVPVAQPHAFPRVRLAEAALAFAGRVYQGSGPVGGEEALLLAGQTYKWLLEGTDSDVNF